MIQTRYLLNSTNDTLPLILTHHPTCCALPVSNLAGLISMPMILLAPAARQPIATARPTAPSPQMAQFEPASTLAVLRAAPYPVGTPQPNKHTLSKGAASFICYIIKIVFSDTCNSVSYDSYCYYNYLSYLEVEICIDTVYISFPHNRNSITSTILCTKYNIL